VRRAEVVEAVEVDGEMAVDKRGEEEGQERWSDSRFIACMRSVVSFIFFFLSVLF
jgi:hypothetical protein